MRGVISIPAGLALLLGSAGPALRPDGKKDGRAWRLGHLYLPGNAGQGMLRADRAQRHGADRSTTGTCSSSSASGPARSSPTSCSSSPAIRHLRKGSKVSVTIGDKKYSNVHQGKVGLGRERRGRAGFIAAMKVGSDMRVSGTSGAGQADQLLRFP